MKIAYIGRVTVAELQRKYVFDPPLTSVTCTFGFGNRLIEELLDRGHSVSVITANLPPEKLAFHHSDAMDVYIIPERPRKLEFPTLYSREIAFIHEALNRIRPDVVLANWTYEFARAALTSGYPTAVVAHDSPWRIFKNNPEISTLFKALYSQFAVFPRVKHLVVVSPHIEHDMRRLNRYQGEIAVIPNALEPTAEDGTQKEIRQNPHTVVMSSQWMQLKNPKTLIKAFVSLRIRHPDWRLVCYGRGFGKDEDAERWMRNEGLALDGIEFMGWNHPQAIGRFLFEEADLFCSPTLEESFGMVFIEAMSRGVPCVGGEKSGAVPWVMGDGGIVCDVSRADTLAECIENVMGDAELRRRLSAGGRRRVAEMFSIEKVVSMYEAELQKVFHDNA